MHRNYRLSRFWPRVALGVLGVLVLLGIGGTALGLADHHERGRKHALGHKHARGHKHATFPLRVSQNGRYLETAGGKPFLLVGDSPQSVIGDLSESSAAAYLADRETHGFDAVWINLLCDQYTVCASNGETYDQVAPFTRGSSPSTYRLSAPNAKYFARAHAIVARAERDGIAVFLDPIETGGCGSGGWMTTLRNNGNGTTSTLTNDYRYGRYLGNEFKDLPNVVWMSGNDFECIYATADTNDAKAVAEGIHATDPSALQTIEADYGNNQGATTCNSNQCQGSSSLTGTAGVSTSWGSQVQLDTAYTYSPTYAEVRAAYREQSSMPTLMGEANYEGQKNFDTDGCGSGPAGDPTARNCRLQEWWTMTSGATGQFYGGPSYGIRMGWSPATIDSIGARQLGYQTSLLKTIEWWKLLPDTSHRLVTRGYGTCPTAGSIVAVTCVTDAYSSSRRLALIYEPTGATITVDMSRMARPTKARWYDPTSGKYTSVSSRVLANSGTRTFTPPAANGAGDHDWVLLLQAAPTR